MLIAQASVPATEPAPEAQETPVVNQPSVLHAEYASEFTVGTPAGMTVELKNLEDRPLPNKVLVIYVDGNQVRRMRTDDNGRAEIYLGRDLPVGQHTVRIESVATVAYQSAVSDLPLTVRPARLHLTTVPPLPNIGFVFDGQTYYTDAGGAVVLEAAEPGVYPLEILPVEPITGSEPMQVNFVRWHDDAFEPQRTVEVQGDDELMVGLSRSYPISLTFVDRQGQPVDSSRIMSVTIKSSHGTRYALDPNEEHWRTANRIARLRNGLEATEVQYGVESVYIDGANVVNQNQQRFIVEGKATWTVQLLLYAARVRAKDALFGFPIGTGVNVRYPDGKLRYIPFDENNELVIDDLARGLYRLQVVGASGIAPETPLSVSRDQDLELKVLSTLDITLAVGGGIVGALGLLLIGRPGPLLWLIALLVRMTRQRKRPAPAHGLLSEHRRSQ
jgi:hypothetical protein